MLRAPGSAKFGSLDRMAINKLSSGTYVVAGTVEAEDSYGAMTQSTFTLRVYKENGLWKSGDRFVSTNTASGGKTGCSPRSAGIFLMIFSAALDIVSLIMISSGDYGMFRTVLIAGSIMFFIGFVLSLIH